MLQNLALLGAGFNVFAIFATICRASETSGVVRWLWCVATVILWVASLTALIWGAVAA
jgi:hypothetical protein